MSDVKCVGFTVHFVGKGRPHAGQHGARGKMDMGEYPPVIYQDK
jgi:hypothetical protein